MLTDFQLPVRGPCNDGWAEVQHWEGAGSEVARQELGSHGQELVYIPVVLGS